MVEIWIWQDLDLFEVLMELALAMAIEAKKAILAIMASMAMANGSYKVAITGIQFKSSLVLSSQSLQKKGFFYRYTYYNFLNF